MKITGIHSTGTARVEITRGGFGTYWARVLRERYAGVWIRLATDPDEALALFERETGLSLEPPCPTCGVRIRIGKHHVCVE